MTSPFMGFILSFYVLVICPLVTALPTILTETVSVGMMLQSRITHTGQGTWFYVRVFVA